MSAGDGGNGVARFPGFHAMSASHTWDRATREAVRSRIEPTSQPPDYFGDRQRRTARSLLARLLDLPVDEVGQMVSDIENRLSRDSTDGWHYAQLPPDPIAWPATLDLLDDETLQANQNPFAECTTDQQTRMLDAVRNSDDWGGLPGPRVWNLWMRYVIRAYWSRPSAWDEIGFPGPAFPRGYKNLGVDALEGIEVADRRPGVDPAGPR